MIDHGWPALAPIRASLGVLVFVVACAGPTAAPSASPTPAVTEASPAPTTASPAVSAPPTNTPSAPTVAGPVWATRAPLLAPNSEIAVAELNGKVVVIGGYPSSRVVVNTVQVYDPTRDVWELSTPLPMALHHAMAAAVNGKLYVIGGETAGSGATFGPVPPTGAGFVDRVFEFDPATGVWSSRASMPTARSAGATAVIDGKIYVAGGRPPRGADFAVYDPVADRWTTLPDLPTQRNHLAAAAIDGKVYVAGGRFGAGVGSEMTAVLEVFDPRTNTWERKAPMPKPRAGINGIAALGCFYVFGGEGNDAVPSGVFAEMEAYNPKTDRWTTLTPLPTPVHGVTGAAFLNGWIHLPGGGVERGGSSGSTIHQVYRPELAC